MFMTQMGLAMSVWGTNDVVRLRHVLIYNIRTGAHQWWAAALAPNHQALVVAQQFFSFCQTSLSSFPETWPLTLEPPSQHVAGVLYTEGHSPPL